MKRKKFQYYGINWLFITKITFPFDIFLESSCRLAINLFTSKKTRRQRPSDKICILYTDHLI